jgi:hypothetical protein
MLVAKASESQRRRLTIYSSPNMYTAHRGMVAPPSNRLTELLDQVRAEFDAQQNRSGEYEQQSKFVSSLACSSKQGRCSILLQPSGRKAMCSRFPEAVAK